MVRIWLASLWVYFRALLHLYFLYFFSIKTDSAIMLHRNQNTKCDALQKINEILQREDSESKSIDVTALSACHYDYFIKVDEIRPDHECRVKGESSHPGGSGANTICGLSKLGKRTAIVGCVKEDEEGEQIIQSFRSHSVDTQLLVKDDLHDSHTGRTNVFVENSGKRLIVVKPGINEFLLEILKEKDLLVNLRNKVRDSKIVHLTSFTGVNEVRLQELVVQDFIDKDTIVSLTPGALYVEKGLEELFPILAHTNMMFLYAEQLDLLLERSSIRGFRQRLPLKTKTELFFKWKIKRKMSHPMILVIKDNLKIQANHILENYISVASNAGDSMNFFSHSNVNFTIGDGTKIALDTTGVGDAVVAGFLYGLLEGKDIRECADLAFILATHVSTRFGARDGLLNKDFLVAETGNLVRIV
jgi:ribokinase